MMRTKQFELWHECNNRCDFCYLHNENRSTSDEAKLLSLRATLKALDDPDLCKDYDCIGYIGGEFFQGQLRNPDVHKAFFELMQKTADLYNSHKIKSVWITATLTIGKQEDLYSVLSLFEDKSNVWVLTSWDTIGRYKTPKMFDTWKHHVLHLHEVFPDLKINCTTILTGDLIQRYLRGEFLFSDLGKRWGIHWFFKHCGTIVPWKTNGNFEEARASKIESNRILPNFFPKRSEYMQFLVRFKEQEPKDLWARLYNIKLRADEITRHMNDETTVVNKRFKNLRLETDETNPLPCGHPFVYSAYIDSDACILCDTQKIGEFDD